MKEPNSSYSRECVWLRSMSLYTMHHRML